MLRAKAVKKNTADGSFVAFRGKYGIEDMITVSDIQYKIDRVKR